MNNSVCIGTYDNGNESTVARCDNNLGSVSLGFVFSIAVRYARLSASLQYR